MNILVPAADYEAMRDRAIKAESERDAALDREAALQNKLERLQEKYDDVCEDFDTLKYGEGL